MHRFIHLVFIFSALHAYSLPKGSLPHGIVAGYSIRTYDTALYNKVICHRKGLAEETGTIRAGNSDWVTRLEVSEFNGTTGAMDISLSFYCTGGRLDNASLALDLHFSDWSAGNYVLMPAALYNGNRYPSRRISYSPKLLDPRDIGPDVGIILSDVPKLNESDGPSFVQLRSGAMATPSFCYWSPDSKKGFILLTDQSTRLGDNGIFAEENNRRDKATVAVMAPVVRELYKYHITDSRYPSDDVPASFSAGDSLTLRARIYVFDAPELQVLFDRFAMVRKDLSGPVNYNNVLPFSAAFGIQEQKFNRDNWVEAHGYYSVGMRENFLQDWQIGWTGGMISTFPLLFAGNEQTQANVVRNFDWLFKGGISPSGFFWDSGEKGTIWHGGDIRKPHTAKWHLVRKSGDGLYFILKQFLLMEKKGMEVKPEWRKGAEGVAKAFAGLWKENGQLGQFVDSQTGNVCVGGSTSGAIVPAALVLAAGYFREPVYLETAVEIGRHYYTNFTQKGLTCGGPGDALQNFDSESGYALIESYFSVFEATGNKFWLQAAEEAARQFSTWVMSYNYRFPEHSTYGKSGIKAAGAVFANTQNTHGSPGICTHSGWVLLKLFRATGDTFYLGLLNDITHAVPQCLAHEGQKLPGVKTGWINERINTTDWLEGIGEMMYGSTWAETALMLIAIQVPGLYVVPDKSLLVCFDNLEATIIEDTASMITAALKNPTPYDAKVKLYEENQQDFGTRLSPDYLLNSRVIEVPAHKQVILTFYKQ